MSASSSAKASRRKPATSRQKWPRPSRAKKPPKNQPDERPPDFYPAAVLVRRPALSVVAISASVRQNFRRDGRNSAAHEAGWHVPRHGGLMLAPVTAAVIASPVIGKGIEPGKGLGPFLACPKRGAGPFRTRRIQAFGGRISISHTSGRVKRRNGSTLVPRPAPVIRIPPFSRTMPQA